MKVFLLLCFCFICVSPVTFSQSSTKRAELDEPPELTVEPKKFTPPSEAMRQLSDVFPKDQNNPDELNDAINRLGSILHDHADFSDASFLRAMFSYCMLKSDNNDRTVNDIDAAIASHSSSSFPSAYDSLASLYAFRAKVEFNAQRYDIAINDLEKAMRQGFDDADSVFNTSGTKPETPVSNRCDWSLADLNLMAQRFPTDYRTRLFRGLFFKHFVAYDEKSYDEATKDFQRAALLDPKSALPHFYLGILSAAVLSPRLVKASESERKEFQNEAVLHYTRAIQLDSGFTPAYEQRAEAYHALNRHAQAIADYDKVIESEPKNLIAYADRGLAKSEIGKYQSAIFDYDEVIRLAKPDYQYLGGCYQKRGNAHFILGENGEAIDDFTKAITSQLAHQGFLFSLAQYRKLYPEYDSVSDENLCRKLNLMFWPEFSYSDFAKHLGENKGTWAIGELNELYEQRGDAYLRAGDFRRGVNDFQRIMRAIPIFATSLDRWRLIAANDSNQVYLDIRSAEFSRDRPSRLWLKKVAKNGNYTVEPYEIDCNQKSLRSTSISRYNSKDELLGNSDVVDEWRRSVPETVGEQLYNGVCSDIR